MVALIRRFIRRLRRFGRLHRRSLFSLCATLIFFMAAELTVRALNLVGRPSRQAPGIAGEEEQSIIDDPQLFWRFRPSQDMEGDERIYRINALGLRDGEVTLPKPPGEYRILSLGESTTFGAGVSLEETYTKVAESLLRQAYPQVRTINAGIGAYTSFQCIKYLEIEGPRLQPDMVWLFSETNDGLACYIRNYRNVKHGSGYTDKELYDIRNRWSGMLNLLNHSDLYKLLRSLQTGQSLRSYRKHVAGRREELQAADEWRPRVPEKDRRENLERFVELSRELGATLVFLIPAYWNSKAEGEALLRRVAEKTGVPTINLPAALYASGRFPECWYSLEELGGHPNALGHRLMGEAIAAAIKPYLAQEITSFRQTDRR